MRYNFGKRLGNPSFKKWYGEREANANPNWTY